MTIRVARYSDLRAAAEVAAAAFIDDELFALMLPHRREYPEDFIRSFEQDLRVQWFDHKYVNLVAVDELSGKVAGIAKWERQGEGGKKREFGRFDPQRLIHPLVALYVGAERWMWPNRAADPSKANVLRDAFELCSFHWEERRKENWYLELIAVHPEYQGKGYGRELVQWGVDEAAREGVCTSVVSAEGKEKFYGRFGFVEVGRSNIGPLSTLEGGAIMFKDVEAQDPK